MIEMLSYDSLKILYFSTSIETWFWCINGPSLYTNKLLQVLMMYSYNGNISKDVNSDKSMF
jgi:hypothetical protein